MPTLCRAVDDGGFGKNLNRVSKNEHATVLQVAERLGYVAQPLPNHIRRFL